MLQRLFHRSGLFLIMFSCLIFSENEPLQAQQLRRHEKQEIDRAYRIFQGLDIAPRIMRSEEPAALHVNLGLADPWMLEKSPSDRSVQDGSSKQEYLDALLPHPTLPGVRIGFLPYRYARELTQTMQQGPTPSLVLALDVALAPHRMVTEDPKQYPKEKVILEPPKGGQQIAVQRQPPYTIQTDRPLISAAGYRFSNYPMFGSALRFSRLGISLPELIDSEPRTIQTSSLRTSLIKNPFTAEKYRYWRESPNILEKHLDLSGLFLPQEIVLIVLLPAEIQRADQLIGGVLNAKTYAIRRKTEKIQAVLLLSGRKIDVD